MLHSNLNYLNDYTGYQYSHQKIKKQRLDCSICNYRIDPNNESEFIAFSCNVRAYRDETFKVWRCPVCLTIHCLDIVDLPYYYANYPFADTKLTFPLRWCYRNLCRQLTKHGFSPEKSLLDYGCGSGLFVQYLRQYGFANCHGYDPYAPQDGFGNPKTLEQKSFNYILLQDVIEHIEDPNALLGELDALLSPGGYILIGTPNAANIDLAQPSLSDYYNAVHVPYHLHIYTRESLKSLGRRQGWEPVDFFDRPYHDTPWFGVNSRTWNQYQRLLDGTINVIFEPLKPWKALTSYQYLIYIMFGYWLSLKTEMAIMFHKTESNKI